MHGARIAAQHQPCILQDIGKLHEIGPAHQIDRRDFHLHLNLCRPLGIQRTAAHDDGDRLFLVEPFGKLGKIPRRPTLIGPVRAHGEYDIGILHARAHLAHDTARAFLLPLRHFHGEDDLFHTAAKFPRNIQIPLHDMPTGMGPDHGL